MKNINENQLKKCIFKELDEFIRDVNKALGKEVKVICDYDGIYFDTNEDGIIDILDAMSKYYDTEVTSIHIDDCDFIGVWIAYK